MPRTKLIRSQRLPYHVTNRGNNRSPFPLPLEEVWEIFSTNLFAVSVVYGLRVHAFVLMPNHFHLLCSTPDGNLDQAMLYFLREGSKTINLKSGRLGHNYGGRYSWSLIDSENYYAHALKYVYRNPVKGGLVALSEDYRFSSLHGLCGGSRLGFPLYYPLDGRGGLLVPPEISDLLAWLNTPHSREQNDAIRAGLRRAEFGGVVDPVAGTLS